MRTLISSQDYRKTVDIFPTELTGIPFDATIEQQQYYTATAIFKYTMYDLIDNDGKKV